MNRFKELPLVKKIGFNRVLLLGVLILMYLFFAVISPTFLSYSRILSALNYAYFLGFLALGVTFAIATGGIDFSIGPVMFCAALIAGQLLTRSGVPVAVCLLVSIFVGFLFGVLNRYTYSSAFYHLYGQHDGGKGNRVCVYQDPICFLAPERGCSRLVP